MSPASPSVSDRIRKQARPRKSEGSSSCNHQRQTVPCPQSVLVQPDFECGMPIPESRHPSQKPAWHEVEQWWVSMARRLGVVERGQLFFKNALGQDGVLERLERVGGDVHYILFVFLRYWIPSVLPPLGRERTSKNDQDYWLESEQILKSAVVRLRELQPLIELLTATNPVATDPLSESSQTRPVVEVELARMLEGIAEVAGSYGGPDFTTVNKKLDPVPLQQTDVIHGHKQDSGDVLEVFLFRGGLQAVGLWEELARALLARVSSAAGIYQPNGPP